MKRLFNVGIIVDGWEIEQRVVPVWAYDATTARVKVKKAYPSCHIEYVEESIE